jgi:hypothetical protein
MLAMRVHLVNRSITPLAHCSVAFRAINNTWSDLAARAHHGIKGYDIMIMPSNESFLLDLKHILLKVVVMCCLITILAQRLFTRLAKKDGSSDVALLTTNDRMVIVINF